MLRLYIISIWHRWMIPKSPIFIIIHCGHTFPSKCQAFSFSFSVRHYFSKFRMENLKLLEEIKELKALGQHYEKLLKLAGIELSDFSEDDMALLDKCVDFAVDSHVHDLSLNNLRDFYCAKKRDSIENKLTKAKRQIELNKVMSDIGETARDVAVLERYKSAAEERLIPEGEVLQKTNALLATKHGLLDRQKGFDTPKDLNIEGIIDKVDSLDGR